MARVQAHMNQPLSPVDEKSLLTALVSSAGSRVFATDLHLINAEGRLLHGRGPIR